MTDAPQGSYGTPQAGPYGPPPYGYPYPPVQMGTNTLAILSSSARGPASGSDQPPAAAAALRVTVIVAEPMTRVSS